MKSRTCHTGQGQLIQTEDEESDVDFTGTVGPDPNAIPELPETEEELPISPEELTIPDIPDVVEDEPTIPELPEEIEEATPEIPEDVVPNSLKRTKRFPNYQKMTRAFLIYLKMMSLCFAYTT